MSRKNPSAVSLGKRGGLKTKKLYPGHFSKMAKKSWKNRKVVIPAHQSGGDIVDEQEVPIRRPKAELEHD